MLRFPYLKEGDTTEKRDGMRAWRDRLLHFMVRNSREAADDYQLPDAQVLEMGSRVRI